jgi:hypothetical protein
MTSSPKEKCGLETALNGKANAEKKQTGDAR